MLLDRFYTSRTVRLGYPSLRGHHGFMKKSAYGYKADQLWTNQTCYKQYTTRNDEGEGGTGRS